jgi:hypothetical protein
MGLLRFSDVCYKSTMIASPPTDILLVADAARPAQR